MAEGRARLGSLSALAIRAFSLLLLLLGLAYGDQTNLTLHDKCGEILAPTNGKVTYNIDDNSIIRRFSCHDGYTLVGPKERVCDSNGTWTGRQPLCKVIQCPLLETPDNGRISYVNTPGGKATFSCNSGHVMSGPGELVCSANGTWSQGPPTCGKGDLFTFLKENIYVVSAVAVTVVLLIGIAILIRKYSSLTKQVMRPRSRKELSTIASSAPMTGAAGAMPISTTCLQPAIHSSTNFDACSMHGADNEYLKAPLKGMSSFDSWTHDTDTIASSHCKLARNQSATGSILSCSSSKKSPVSGRKSYESWNPEMEASSTTHNRVSGTASLLCPSVCSNLDLPLGASNEALFDDNDNSYFQSPMTPAGQPGSCLTLRPSDEWGGASSSIGKQDHGRAQESDTTECVYDLYGSVGGGAEDQYSIYGGTASRMASVACDESDYTTYSMNYDRSLTPTPSNQERLSHASTAPLSPHSAHSSHYARSTHQQNEMAFSYVGGNRHGSRPPL